MKALYYDGKQAVYREDMPIPEYDEGHSLIKTMIADICNTDREILKGYRPDFRGIMGHEFVGCAGCVFQQECCSDQFGLGCYDGKEA